MKPKSLWLTIVAVVACIGCCSVPLYALLIGSAGLAALLNQTTLEIVKCALPLVVFAVGYLIYYKHQVKKRCCASARAECGKNQCSTHSSGKS